MYCGILTHSFMWFHVLPWSGTNPLGVLGLWKGRVAPATHNVTSCSWGEPYVVAGLQYGSWWRLITDTLSTGAQPFSRNFMLIDVSQGQDKDHAEKQKGRFEVSTGCACNPTLHTYWVAAQLGGPRCFGLFHVMGEFSKQPSLPLNRHRAFLRGRGFVYFGAPPKQEYYTPPLLFQYTYPSPWRVFSWVGCGGV